MTWKDDAGAVLRTLFGLSLAAVCGGFLRLEMKSAVVHSGHVYLFASGMALGCLVAVPSLMSAALGQAVKFLAAILQALRSGPTPPPPAAP